MSGDDLLAVLISGLLSFTGSPVLQGLQHGVGNISPSYTHCLTMLSRIMPLAPYKLLLKNLPCNSQCHCVTPIPSILFLILFTFIVRRLPGGKLPYPVWFVNFASPLHFDHDETDSHILGKLAHVRHKLTMDRLFVSRDMDA